MTGVTAPQKPPGARIPNDVGRKRG